MRHTALVLPVLFALTFGCSTAPTTKTTALVGVDKKQEAPFITYATSVYFATVQPNGNECWYKNTLTRYTKYDKDTPADAYVPESQELLTPLSLGRASLVKLSKDQLTNAVKENLLGVNEAKLFGVTAFNLAGSALTYLTGGALGLAARLARNTQWFEMGQALQGQASRYGSEFVQGMDIILPKLAKIKNSAAVVFYTTRNDAGNPVKVVGLMEYGSERIFEEQLAASSNTFGQGACPAVAASEEPIPEPTPIGDDTLIGGEAPREVTIQPYPMEGDDTLNGGEGTSTLPGA